MSINPASGSPSGAAGAPRLRADAQANLVRVLDAAERVFAEHGLGASIELVAQAAGVGLGTIYRRFPNKQALVAELVNRLLGDVVALGEQHCDDPDGSGLAAYMVAVCELLATHRGALARLWNDPSSTQLIRRSRAVQQELVDTAKAHGVVRADLTGEDIAVTLWAMHGILDVTRGVPVNAWRRHLDLIMAGFADHAVPLTAPPLSRRMMTRIIASAPTQHARPSRS